MSEKYTTVANNPTNNTTLFTVLEHCFKSEKMKFDASWRYVYFYPNKPMFCFIYLLANKNIQKRKSW